MRGNISIRVIIACALIGLTWGGLVVVMKGRHVDTVLPKWNLADLPLQLGNWVGEDAPLDKKLNDATGAASIVNRVYRNPAGIQVTLHFAVFKDPNEGIGHNPVSCYDSAGWVPKESDKETMLDTEEEKDNSQIQTGVWERSDGNGERCLVGYWYELGEYRLYGRGDLGWSIRWKMRGHKIWPALIKVLLQTQYDRKPEEARTQMLDFAKEVYQWINLPEHQMTVQAADEAGAKAAESEASK
jgi:EpsI family protein